MNSIRRQKDMTLKDELPRSVVAQYTAGKKKKKKKTTKKKTNKKTKSRNSSRRNDKAKPKRKQHRVVDVSGGESKVRFCRE